MPIYDEPTKILMRQFGEQQLKPGQVFDKKLAVDWFAKNYPKIKDTTVQMHVEAMATNSPLRMHHPSIKSGSQHDYFFKISPGHFRLWNPESDPQPIYKSTQTLTETEQSLQDEAIPESSSEFAYENDLKNYLVKNLYSLGDGLKLYDDEGLSGVEFNAGGRFVDILAVDKTGDFVVVELKVSRGYDKVVGQLMRYMAWVKKNLAEGKAVHGIIVASDISEDLKLAASLLPNVKLVEYELSFKLRSVSM